MSHLLEQHRVFGVRTEKPGYDDCPPVDAPELPCGVASHQALVLLRNLFSSAGLDKDNFGKPEWNPLTEVINRGDKVVIKPNWVFHYNRSGESVDSLLTHSKVIEAIVHYVLKCKPGSVIIGDAPIQGCNFEALLENTKIREALEVFKGAFPNIRIRDFRCVIRDGVMLESSATTSERALDEYVLFDMGDASTLEPISDQSEKFRVTMYNPDDIIRTHSPGKHQYLVAREVIDANVVISVPKLKSHGKACITGAIKNMVGINGHKSFLPHHRKGGTTEGGDCYYGWSMFKRIAEELLDIANRSTSPPIRKILHRIAKACLYTVTFFGHKPNVDGSWYGNDTVWRMSLDLQRILHYGTLAARLDSVPRRKIITITDAIIAGDGEGPLEPTPVSLGILTLGVNTAALEWMHALLMGFDPARIPITKYAFDDHRFPLTDFSPEEIIMNIDGREVTRKELIENHSQDFKPPEGWVGHCELSRSAK